MTFSEWLIDNQLHRLFDARAFGHILLFFITAVPLTMRVMGWQPPLVTVCRMDAASERTWTYLQRVTGGGCQFMSRMGLILVNPDTVAI